MSGDAITREHLRSGVAVPGRLHATEHTSYGGRMGRAGSARVDGVICAMLTIPACATPAEESFVATSTDPSSGCKIAERILGEDERYEHWPSPQEIVSRVSGTYAGVVAWGDTVESSTDEIQVTVSMDPAAALLRYPTSPAAENEPMHCGSSLVIPFEFDVLLGDESVALAVPSVVWSSVVRTRATLPDAITQSFAEGQPEGYTLHVQFSLSGGPLLGRIDYRRPLEVPFTAGTFNLERKAGDVD